MSSGVFTAPHRLLPFLRFSSLYPRILVPPVSDGGDQERLMQSLKALITFGADGGPGYAVHTKKGFFKSFPSQKCRIGRIDCDVKITKVCSGETRSHLKVAHRNSLVSSIEISDGRGLVMWGIITGLVGELL